MDITIYLPDDLGGWAKAQELPLSRMLRAAVTEERERREAVAHSLKSAEVHHLDVEDEDGLPYVARLHGALIAHEGGPKGGVYVYLGADGVVYVYDAAERCLHRGVSAEGLRRWLREGAYAEVMRALGESVVVDVGLPG